jgi:uncharacterized membrane protein (DUF373 family)
VTPRHPSGRAQVVPPHPEPVEMGHRLGSGIAPLLAVANALERFIVAVVVVLLAGTAMLLAGNSLGDLWHALAGNGSEHTLTNLLSQALLILMIGEIIGTVASFLERGTFDAMPFLIVGIIASIRRLLVISAEAAEFISQEGEIPVSVLAELAILAALIAIFAWAIKLLRPVDDGQGSRLVTH